MIAFAGFLPIFGNDKAHVTATKHLGSISLIAARQTAGRALDLAKQIFAQDLPCTLP